MAIRESEFPAVNPRPEIEPIESIQHANDRRIKPVKSA